MIETLQARKENTIKFCFMEDKFRSVVLEQAAEVSDRTTWGAGAQTCAGAQVVSHPSPSNYGRYTILWLAGAQSYPWFRIARRQ